MATVESLKAAIEPLRGVIKYQQLQLEALEKQLFELENPVETRPLSDAEMKKRVIALETRNAYKSSWKKAVEDGLLSNVHFIMCEDTYYSYLEVDVDNDATEEEKRAAKETSKKRKAYLGPFGGLKWQLFLLQIIKNLHEEGSFVDESGGFDTFEDTAGGCDEVLWQEGCEILEAAV
jgi:hypothetical protein